MLYANKIINIKIIGISFSFLILLKFFETELRSNNIHNEITVIKEFSSSLSFVVLLKDLKLRLDEN